MVAGGTWLGVRGICDLFGWKSVNSFRENWLKRLPKSAVRKKGRGKADLYDAAALHRIIVDRAREEERERRTAANGDPLLSGPESPSLEEYRRHRARVAKCEADEREGLLVRRDAAKAAVDLVVIPFKRVCEKCPTCGPALSSSIALARAELERAVKRA